MKKLLVGLGVVIAVLLVAGIVLVLTVHPDQLVNAHKDKIATLVSTKLGREVRLGSVEASVLPVLRARVGGITLAGSAQGAPAQVELDGVEVVFSLWDALISLGRDLSVKQIVVQGLRVRATRDPAGVWDFQDVLDHLSEPGAEPAPTPEAPKAPRDLSFLRDARVERVALEGARIEINDAALGRPLAVSDLTIEVLDIRLGAPIVGQIRATLVDGERRSPLALRLQLAELRQDLSFDPIPAVELDVKLSQLALGPWGGLLPADALAPAQGQLDIDLALRGGPGLQRLTGKGQVAVAEVVLRQAGQRGAPLSLRLGLDAEVDLGAPRYQVRQLSADGTGVQLRSAIDATGLSPAELQNADVALQVEDLGRVLAVLPTGAALLPEDLTLEGPVKVTVKGNTQSFAATVDLDQALVRWSDQLDKQKGRPLNLKVQGQRSGDQLRLPAVALVVDAMQVGGSLVLGTKPGAPVQADLQTGEIKVADLKRLLPALARGLEKGRSVAGSFQIALKAQAQDGAQQAEANVKLSALDIDIEGLTAKGNGAVVAAAQPRGEDVTLALRADLTGLAVTSQDAQGARVLDKPAGMKLELDVEALKTPQQLDLRRASAAFGATRIAATGGVSALNTDAPRLDLDFGELDLAFDDLRRTLPGAASLPAGGGYKGGLKLSGNPSDLSTIAVAATVSQLAYGDARLSGSLGVRDLVAPNFEFDLQSPALDIDGLLGEEDETEQKPKAAKEKSGDDNPHGLSSSTRALLATVSGKGKIRVGRAIFKGTELKNFVGQLVMTKGVVRFDALDFDVYGGRFSAAGTTMDLPAEYTGYTLKMDVQHLDLASAVGAYSRAGKAFKGQVDKNIDVSGRGLSMADLANSLSGPVSLKTDTLSLTSLDVLGAIDAPLKKALGPAAPKGFKGLAGASGKKKEGGTSLTDLTALLRFKGGKFKLDKPVRSDTSFGAMELSGGGALDNTLDFAATALLAPAVVNKAFGKNVVKQPVAVPMKIGGTWLKPTITGIDVQALVASLAGAPLADLQEKAGAEAEKLKQAAVDAAKEAEAKAKAEADKAKKEAEAKAKAEADKVKKAAEKEKKEAEAKAKKEAEKKKKEAEAKAKKEAEKKKKEAEAKAKKAFGL